MNSIDEMIQEAAKQAAEYTETAKQQGKDIGYTFTKDEDGVTINAYAIAAGRQMAFSYALTRQDIEKVTAGNPLLDYVHQRYTNLVAWAGG